MKRGVIGILGFIAGALTGFTGSLYFNVKKGNKMDIMQNKVDKFRGYYNMLNQWIAIKQEGKYLEKYFLDHGYKTIAIYGMGVMGNRLYDELKNSDKIEIKYGIDINPKGVYSELEVKDVDDVLENVDAVVVSAIYAFDEIKEKISKILDGKIISLDEIIYEM